MARITKIKGVESLLRKLEKLERNSKRENNGTINVGYGASYAVFVHENKEMKLKGQKRPLTKDGGDQGRYWDPQGRGQNKFLETPARTMKNELARVVTDGMKNGASLIKALLAAGLRLQRESQRLVPVHTGNLKASAFTEEE